MTTFRDFASIFVILILGCSSWIHGTIIFEDFDRKLLALYKAVDYVHRRPHQMNADATLGITIAQANIIATVLHENLRYLGGEYVNILGMILDLCDSTRRQLLKEIVSDNRDIQLLHQTLNNPGLWIQRVSWRNGSLEEPTLKTERSYQTVFDLIMQGTPKEEESDQCLAEIIRSKSNGHCQIPETCIDILSTRDDSRGYPLTHRLLIIKVARAFGCEETSMRFSDLVFSYCTAILRDLDDMAATGFPFNTPDLMTEQVLLCGMEGFQEFTSDRYGNLILGWSHSSGCFSATGFQKKRPLVRRSSTKTDFGCDSHATGLAAAAISLLIRENVENAFS